MLDWKLGGFQISKSCQAEFEAQGKEDMYMDVYAEKEKGNQNIEPMYNMIDLNCEKLSLKVVRASWEN